MIASLPVGAASPAPPEDPAEIDVQGYGLLGNRKLERALRLLADPEERPELLGANFIEDAALILMAQLSRDGFLKPRVVARLTLADTRQLEFVWDRPVLDEPLPRPLEVRRAEFHIFEGVRYYYRDLQFQGLTVLREKDARSYFVETGALLPLKRTRVFSPDRLQRGLSSLTEVLNRRGYESARATAEEERDDRTGRVDVTIEVEEGQQSIVRSIRTEVYHEGREEPTDVSLLKTNVPFSRPWLQDFVQELRATNYHLGFPDTTVEVTQPTREAQDDHIEIDLLAQVRSGPKIRLGEVKFEGNKKSRESMLKRRVRLREDRLLDRIHAERGRYRLARLGIFDSVGLTYEKVDENTRDVVYKLEEGKTIDFSLLFGYGSYELLRGGIELEQNNIFGRAHHARLRLVQSFRASYGTYLYSMPEFVGEDVEVFIEGSALRREEIDFTREEYGGGLGARKFLDLIQSDVRVRYNYQVLNAADWDFDPEEGLSSANVGAAILEVRHDQLDNPLYPRRGYKIFGDFELASEYLAGDVDYQRFELHLSYHQPIDEGRWLHFGLSHGAVFTVGSAAEDLPFNRRFFLGGDSSIRGFQQGEAAPRNTDGKLVGAETYLFGSVEFEQSLTRQWSLVSFFDTASFARRISDYPFDENLYSVGGGIRWKTIIGPVRLEYGHNLNPRKSDPAGTLQFSVGFPF
ncbi:MAG: outer membrane protein assembly factor [Verrucomicrobiia bacterium]